MPWRFLLDLLFPPLCHVCNAFIPDAGELLICPDCLQKMTFITPPLCPTCGVPFATEGDSGHLCGPCITDPPDYFTRSATLYAGPVQELIHRFKYGTKVHLCQPLGLIARRAVAEFPDEIPDVVVPVPLHRKRLRQRGFNQSQLLGKVLAKGWRLPMSVGNLRRVRWTEPQTGLDAGDRASNVTGAFAVSKPELLRGRRVLLVDDVLTTGSTMRACVDALKEAEVASVLAVTVARGLRGGV